MTHLQVPVPNWPDMLPHLPDDVVFKAFDGSVLREAKQKWTALGRDPKRLKTVLRYFFTEYFFSDSLSECVSWWTNHYPKFIDGTYISQYAPYVDFVESLNEHTDSRMVTDKVLLKPHLTTEQAAVQVWNSTYRGKIVPDHVKLIIVNGPVGNDIPKEFFTLVIESDNVLGYHNYTKYLNKVRDPQDFRFHSGRWNVNELNYGLKPMWAFTEGGPYLDSAKGWRSPDVLDGDENLLVQANRLVIEDIQKTDAYLKGRILGPTCYFTSGGGEGWKLYELFTPQLIKLADMEKAIWHPGTGENDVNVNKVLAELTKIETSTATIRAEVLPPVPFKCKAAIPCDLYDAPNGKVIRTITDGRTMDVNTVSGTWLKVTTSAPIYWVRIQDVTVL